MNHNEARIQIEQSSLTLCNHPPNAIRIIALNKQIRIYFQCVCINTIHSLHHLIYSCFQKSKNKILIGKLFKREQKNPTYFPKKKYFKYFVMMSSVQQPKCPPSSDHLKISKHHFFASLKNPRIIYLIEQTSNISNICISDISSIWILVESTGYLILCVFIEYIKQRLVTRHPISQSASDGIFSRCFYPRIDNTHPLSLINNKSFPIR